MVFKLLYYNNLDYTGLKTQFDKVVKFLREGDFKSAEVKKLKPTSYYRAKLDAANRLLFTPISHEGKIHLLILEVIKNHAYDKSRFLRGAKIIEEEITYILIGSEETKSEIGTTSKLSAESKTKNVDSNEKQLQYIPLSSRIHLLDKFIGFDEIQEETLTSPLPLIIIGSAGSGKTSLTLEKLKTLYGHILYISLSSYLVSHAQRVYFSCNYYNDQQDIDFLTFKEFLETIEIPQSSEITKSIFLRWYNSQAYSKKIGDGHKLFEELMGVITGSDASKAYLSKDDYLTLGIKQSIYLESDRLEVYALFEKYLEFLSKEKYYDSNILSYSYKDKIKSQYDAVVVDEVQDFTNSQLSLVLKSLNTTSQSQFLLCGDANQIVHPNFFSWSQLKSYFYKDADLGTQNITRILTKNYRNSPEVTELANRVLRFKNYCFGSIDKESHYLIESTSNTHGTVNCLEAKPEVIKKINDATSRSTSYAILVLYANDKKRVKEFFNTPLVFTVQEAKGLEYDNIILFDFISSESTYREISKDVHPSFLESDFKYARAKEKTDKSLEIYKFYVNALYIAITRSICNVYMIESNINHTLIKLLNINEIKEVNIETNESSKEEWQKEASNLALQGKEEQAKAIEEEILQYNNVSWQTITTIEFQKLKAQVFGNMFAKESKYEDATHNIQRNAQNTHTTQNAKIADKREIIKLLNYAIIYNDNKVIDDLQAIGVKAARNISKCEIIMQDEYFSDYIYRNDKNMLKNVASFGIDFRNIFNLTPLMCAAYVGNSFHIDKLILLGASIDEVDNNNRNSFMIALSKAIYNKKFGQDKFSEIYHFLKPDSLSIKSNNKLIKIDAYKPEYLFLIVVFTIIKNTAGSLDFINGAKGDNSTNIRTIGFRANDLLVSIQNFSEAIVPEHRKKREYISGLLSRNEIYSQNPSSKQLFTRISRGIYSINQDMQLKVKDDWHKII